jgi:alanine dehydrogenase
MNDILTRLSRSIAHREGPPATRGWKKRRVELVIGTDREIGRKEGSKGLGGSTQERRVGITPAHVAELRELFKGLELGLTVLVLERAGARAGYADADYVHAGAEIVGRDELVWHDGPPDVVHALKEPSSYEADLPGPFLRIGALHSGDFHQGSGFSRLLEKGNVTVFDGSNIGAAGSFRIPVRGRMSVFAGEIAAEWVIEHLATRHLQGNVVVAGGGYAGKACARKLLAGTGVAKVIIVENAKDPARAASIAQEFADTGRVQVVPLQSIDDPMLLTAMRDAAGLVFAVAAPKGRAPHVVTIDALQALSEAAIVVDISIDERGAIVDSRADADWPSDRLIPHFEAVLLPRRYRAITNMPRAYPFEASRAHGEAILPYLATLLYLAAREGGAAGVTEYLRTVAVDRQGPDPLRASEPEMISAFVQDLRNGMAVHPTARGLVLADTIPPADRTQIASFLSRNGLAVASE